MTHWVSECLILLQKVSSTWIRRPKIKSTSVCNTPIKILVQGNVFKPFWLDQQYIIFNSNIDDFSNIFLSKCSAGVPLSVCITYNQNRSHFNTKTTEIPYWVYNFSQPKISQFQKTFFFLKHRKWYWRIWFHIWIEHTRLHIVM
jgi:hypothetical protein